MSNRARNRANAAMAQQVEHVLGKDEVTGSNPVSSSTYGTVQEWTVPVFLSC